MKRHFFIALVLMLCAFRSFSGEYIQQPATNFDAEQSPLALCRYKKPFPFQCVQLIKKRLSNPPETGSAAIFNGHLQQPPPSNDALPCVDNLPVPAQQQESETALPFFPATHRYTCGIERNVFHPPPSAA